MCRGGGCGGWTGGGRGEGGGDTEGVTAAPSSASLRKPLQRLIPSSPAAQPQDQGYYPTIPAGNENPEKGEKKWNFYVSYYSLTYYCSLIDASLAEQLMKYICFTAVYHFRSTQPMSDVTRQIVMSHLDCFQSSFHNHMYAKYFLGRSLPHLYST